MEFPEIRSSSAAVTQAGRRRPTDVCSSCGTRLLGRAAVTAFLCPNCGERAVGRCAQCRDQGVKYSCSACGYSGP